MGRSRVKELREAWVSFSATTTLHGVVNVTRNSGICRLLWIVLCLTATGFASYQLVFITRKHMNKPVEIRAIVSIFDRTF